MSVLFLNNYTPERPSWFAEGQKRLVASAKRVNVPLLALSEWPDGERDCPYAIKAETFMHAFDLYPEVDIFIWADCSAWFDQYPKQVIDLVKDHGYFSIDNTPWTLAQTCNDHSLQVAGITRKDAKEWPDVASGIMGFDLSQATGRALCDQWLQLYYKGAFNGSRNHDKQSKDPDFMFHRQDQSAWGLAHMILDLDPISDWGKQVSLSPKTKRTHVEIYMQGL